MKRNYSEEIPEGRELVLADFPNQISNLPKWHWRSFADTVMGGKSYLVPPEIVATPDGYALRLSGQVETQGGGFIQIRLQREKKAVSSAETANRPAEADTRGTVNRTKTETDDKSDRIPGILPGRSPNPEQEAEHGSGSKNESDFGSELETRFGSGFRSEQEYNKKYGRENGIFDASHYTGVKVDVKAPPWGSYFIFIRTRDNFFPWSYYASSIDVPAQRGSISIPWSAFTGQSTLRKTIRPRLLRSIAFVAAFKDFTANLYIYRLSLYK